MPKQIRMPKLSDTMEEGTLIAWRKKEGDPIERGEILADIETDKADMEFESFTSGVVQKLLVPPGTTVEVGAPIAVIRLPGESEADAAVAAETVAAPAPRAVAPATPGAPRAAAPPTAATPPPAQAAGALPPAVAGERISVPLWDDERLRATPRARRMAEEKSIDLTEVDGSGPGGAILVADLEKYLSELDAHASDAQGVRATPLALRMAGDLGVDLETAKGTGPGGRVTKSDVLEHVRLQDRISEEREGELFRGAQQLSQKRKALIRNMIRSKAEAPHFYLQMDVSTDALKRVRDELNRETGEHHPRLTYTHLMIKAAALALEKSPEVNATYRDEDKTIALYERINVGLAVDVNDELVAPTIKDCQGKSVFQLAEEANRLIQRARMRKLQVEDYADGTFTISNLGMFGVDRFYAIITPPQSCILSVSAIQPRPVVREGRVEVSSVTTLGLSVDHRVLDGVRAAQFLGEIKRLLEAPEELASDVHAFGS